MAHDPADRMTDRQVAEVIRHLEHAEESHRRWLRTLHGGLVCGHGFGPEVLDADAHRRCRFGQWYYLDDGTLLRDHPEYLALEVLHRVMHDSAREVARAHQTGQQVPDALYDMFMDRQELFAESVLTLRDRLREYLFSFDTLTGVMTREPFLSLLAAQMERSRRGGEPAVLAMLDLDHFKRVNDTYGHLVGDRVLGELGQFLSRNLRRYDLICRYGGEEFLACLPGVLLAEARAILDRLRQDLAGHDIPVDGSALRVTASVGLAALLPDQDSDVSIGHADEALYAAKAAGRNRVICYPELD